MEQLEKRLEKEFELGRIEFEEGAFKRNGNIFYHFISEERIREIIREELADLQQLKDEK